MASGRTPGRRAAEDPSAVPVGTDEEAAGAGPGRDAIALEGRRAQIGRGRIGLTAAQAANLADRRDPVHGESISPRLVVALAIFLSALSGVLLWLAGT